MISGYFFPALFSIESDQLIVVSGQVILTSFGQLALGLLIYVLEHTKNKPSDAMINMGFFLSGALIGVRFIPNQYDILWTGFGWKQQYGSVMIGLSVAQFILVLVILGPLVFQIWRRIRSSDSYKAESKILFYSFSIMLLIFAIYMILVNSLGIITSSLSMTYYFFLIPLAGFAAIIGRLLRFYPTIFFASSHDIIEIQFISKSTRNVAYRFQFLPERPDTDVLIISVAHDSIESAFQDALNKQGEVKSIKVQENEVLACEGRDHFGLLVTRRGSELFHRLLVISLDLFEAFQIATEGSEKEEFDLLMKNYFQFAMQEPNKIENTEGEV